MLSENTQTKTRDGKTSSQQVLSPLINLFWQMGSGDKIDLRSGFRWKNAGVLPSNLVWAKDLTNQQTMDWNREKISSAYTRNLVPWILSTPITTLAAQDWLAWTEDLFGTYSVKAGYHLLIQMANHGQIPSFPWHAIWKLLIPSKSPAASLETEWWYPTNKGFLVVQAYRCQSIVPSVVSRRDRSPSIPAPCFCQGDHRQLFDQTASHK